MFGVRVFLRLCHLEAVLAPPTTLQYTACALQMWLFGFPYLPACSAVQPRFVC